MSNYEILSIDAESNTMVVDWGDSVFNHDIPLYLLEFPQSTQAEIDEHIEYMRPPKMVPLKVPEALLAKVKPPRVPTDEEVRAEFREGFVVSTFQAQAALTMAGYSDDIEALLADPTTDPLTVLAWNKAQEFRRSSPTVAEIAVLLGITDEQLDDLFKYAATIEA